MVDGAAPVAAQHTRGMRVVHHHDGAVLFGGLHQPGQRPDVAIHRENAVGNQQFSAGHRVQFGQNPLRRRHVFVRENVDLGPGEPAAIDDAGMVQLVGNDMVVRSEDRRNRARVGGKAGLKHHASFHVLEGRDALFQLQVQLHGAGNSAHRARTHAILAHRFERRLAQARMRGQPQVIVGGEVDDVLAIEARFSGAFRFQHAQALVTAFAFPLFNLIVEVRQRIRHQSPV